MQADMAEVAWLVDAVFVAEKQPHVIAGVIEIGAHVFMGDKGDIRIDVAEQGDERLGHGASQAAVMARFEFHGVGEPPNGVSEGADRKVDQDVPASGGIIVCKHAFPGSPNLNSKGDEVSFGAVDAAGSYFGLVQDIPGLQITQPDAPGLLAFRQDDTAAVVEINSNAVRRLLSWQCGGRRKCRLGCCRGYGGFIGEMMAGDGLRGR